MESCYVITRDVVTRKQLQEFVEDRGGYWNPEPTLNQGVLEEGSGRIFASVEDPEDWAYEPDELAALEKILGKPPRSVIGIDIGHGKGSSKLAEIFAQELLERWPGYFDDNTSELIDPTSGQSG